MQDNSHRNVTDLVHGLQGLVCWYVSCGGCTVPTFELALGRKMPRQDPLTNMAQSEEFRRYEGEASLFVWCTWRLDGPNGPLTSSDDTDANIVTQMEKLIGTTIQSVAPIPPAWDLIIGFANGLTLRVFCDHVPGDPSWDGNWDLCRQGTALEVGPGTRVVFEDRSQPVGPAASAEG